LEHLDEIHKRLSDINLLLQGEPLDLHVGDLVGSSGDVIFVDVSLRAKLRDLIERCNAFRTTILVAQTLEIAGELNRLKDSRHLTNVEIVDGAAALTAQGWDLNRVDRAVCASAVKNPQAVRLFSSGNAVNVIRSEHGPLLILENLPESSVFRQNGTVYLFIDQALRFLRAYSPKNVIAIMERSRRRLLQAA
jgi:hypothetical protein